MDDNDEQTSIPRTITPIVIPEYINGLHIRPLKKNFAILEEKIKSQYNYQLETTNKTFILYNMLMEPNFNFALKLQHFILSYTKRTINRYMDFF